LKFINHLVDLVENRCCVVKGDHNIKVVDRMIIILLFRV